MKKLIILSVWCLVMSVCMKAAPPLRGLVPMKLSDSTLVSPSVVPPYCRSIQCASQAMISNDLYLQHTGTPRVLTILAAFQDVPFTVNDPVKAFDQYLNADKQVDLGNMNQLNVASVRQYFETSSHRQFSPQFDVVGPITLPKKMAYYGGKNSSGTDENIGEFCRSVTEQAKRVVDDWSIYDNDGDGRIELVCVIFAGFGQNQGGADSAVWAKATRQNIELNNKLRITRFNCNPELFHPQYPTFINGTGVFIHEFSHCLGLPDLYATTSRGYVNNQGMESYSIMDYGLYNYNGFAPCPYTAWEQEVMGWTTLEDVRSKMTDGRCQIADMLPLIEGGKAYKLANSANDRDYIVMENLQKRGLNSRGEGHGLLVYHVDYPYSGVSMTDSPNNNPGHPSVAVIPAAGLLVNSYLRGRDDSPYTREEWRESLESSVFPGTKNVTSLTNQMALPNYCFWDGSTAKETGFMLSDITEDTQTGAVSFTVAPDDATGIESPLTPHLSPLTSHPSPLTSYYDLQGRRVARPTRGLYIVRGKRLEVRGER